MSKENYGTDTDGNSIELSSQNLLVKTNLNHKIEGDYYYSYEVYDNAGNLSNTVTRQVQVKDSNKPTISLVGSDHISHEVNTEYIDQGLNITDDSSIYDVEVKVTNPEGLESTFDLQRFELLSNWSLNRFVDTSILGEHKISYTAIDRSIYEKNKSNVIERTVNVVDTTLPTVNVISTNSIGLSILNPYEHEVRTEYNDQGAEYYDNGGSFDTSETTYKADVNFELTEEIVEDGITENTNLGNFIIEYKVDDGENTPVKAYRYVSVVDTTKPEIQAEGGAEIILEHTDTYQHLNYPVTATDNYDNTLTLVNGGIEVISSDSTVQPLQHTNFTDATFTYVFEATDNSNNSSQFTRTVRLLNNLPLITINPDETFNHQLGSTYTDAEPTATSRNGSNLTSSIVAKYLYNGEEISKENIKDLDIDQKFTVKYSVVDNTRTDGKTYSNSAEKEITITDSLAPIIFINNEKWNGTVVQLEHKVKTDFDLPNIVSVTDDDNQITSYIAYYKLDANNNVIQEVTSIDIDNLGKFKIQYTATDRKSNSTTAELEVSVIDSTKPVITVTDGDLEIQLGENIEPGSTAVDNFDVDLDTN